MTWISPADMLLRAACHSSERGPVLCHAGAIPLDFVMLGGILFIVSLYLWMIYLALYALPAALFLDDGPGDSWSGSKVVGGTLAACAVLFWVASMASDRVGCLHL